MVKNLSLDLFQNDELLVSGPARISVIKRAGRRIRVMVKADESVKVTRIVSSGNDN